jgi:rare lipoprotein A
MRAAFALTAALGVALLGDACRAPVVAPPGPSIQTGVASWYGPGFHGRTTANRETYDMYDATAAHKTLPFGTRVLVTNLDNGKSAIVRINDRGPFVGDRIIDLSYSAAYLLDMLGPGTAMVRLEILSAPPRASGPASVSVQVGAFSAEGTARKLAERLAPDFPGVRVSTFRTPGRDLYRVRIPAANKSEALEIARRLTDRGFPVVIFEDE